MNAPLTLRCPVGGEEWPATEFKCDLDLTPTLIMPRHIHFLCPADHFFSLARAVREKKFTKEQCEKIVAAAREEQKKHKPGIGLRGRADGWPNR